MKKVIYAILIMILSVPLSGYTVKGGVTYTVETARKEAFADVEYTLPKSIINAHKTDPNYKENMKAKANGVKNDLKHERGVISMARAMDPNSAGSQFFIMHADAPHLDGNYAAFGKVIDGMDAVDRIAAVRTNMFNDAPVTKVVIKSMTVDTKGEEFKEPVKLKEI